MSLELILSGLIVLITHALEAVTGFGCTVLAMPFTIQLLGLERAKMLLMVLAWILALYFVITKFNKINWKQFGIILLFVGLGLPIGIWAFVALKDHKVILIKALGAFIIFSSVMQLYKSFFPESLKKSLPKPVYFLFLFFGGIVHGAFATGGPFVVLYASKALPDKGEFRATLCLLWTTLNTILIAQALASGVMVQSNGIDILWMLPFLLVGIIAGEWIHKKVDGKLFSRVVFGVLLLTGLFMLFF